MHRVFSLNLICIRPLSSVKLEKTSLLKMLLNTLLVTQLPMMYRTECGNAILVMLEVCLNGALAKALTSLPPSDLQLYQQR
jgi:hypothetical protein